MRAAAALAGLPLLVLLLAGCASSTSGGEDANNAAPATAPEPESNIVIGTLNAATPAVDVPIPLGAGHGRLAVMLQMGRPVPESRLSMTVTGPGGEEAGGSTAPFLYAFPGTRPVASFGDPAAGSWTAHIELSGATADYRVDWCADDKAVPGPFTNEACQGSG